MKTPKYFEFPVVRDQFLSVNKSELITTYLKEFDVKLTSDDIKILKDGIQLMVQFGVENTNLSDLKFRKISDFMTGPNISQVTYDSESLKMWIEPSPEFLFVNSDDETLTVVKSGIDAPAGTVQVSVENKLYTLLYSREDMLLEAITEALNFVGHKISTKPMTKDRQVDDHRVSIIRKKFGKASKMYNDRVNFEHPVINKIIVHV